jgi:F-type H+-transporting ATPase subunit gamma
MESANQVFKMIQTLMESSAYAKVSVGFSKFRSALSQEATIEQIIPVNKEAFLGVASRSILSSSTIYEPSPEVILNRVIPEAVRLRILYAILESTASEHGARMNAMENATSNAGQMIKTLKLTYNKLRQASITKELLEITAGVESMKS